MRRFGGSLKMEALSKTSPSVFFQVGIAEANMMGIAAGLATSGKIPYTGTFANFSTGRVYDQLRQSIAYSDKNVTVCASHAGLTLGEDGATHQILEDIGMIKMLPGFAVICPCDYNQTKAATTAIAEHYRYPVYLRFGRPNWPVFTPENQRFEIGKAWWIEHRRRYQPDRHRTYGVAARSRPLACREGISRKVINVHTIKPLEQETILDSVSKTKCGVSAEEHQRLRRPRQYSQAAGSPPAFTQETPLP